MSDPLVFGDQRENKRTERRAVRAAARVLGYEPRGELLEVIRAVIAEVGPEPWSADHQTIGEAARAGDPLAVWPVAEGGDDA